LIWNPHPSLGPDFALPDKISLFSIVNIQ